MFEESTHIEGLRRVRTGLWRNPDFMKLWSAQTISEFGSTITREALPLTAALVLAASPIQVNILAAVQALPVLLIGLWAGVWADRLPRRPIMVGADLGRALLLGSIPAAALLGVLGMWQLYVVGALAGALTIAFRVADQSFLPSVVRREHIVEGNSKLAATGAIAEVGAPPLAGGLVQLFTAPIAIAFDAVSFLFSALFIGLIRTRESRPPAQEVRQATWREAVYGLRVVLGTATLRALAAGSGTLSFFGGFLGFYVLFAVKELRITPAILGIVIGVGGVSSLVGALVAGRIARRFGLGPTMIGTLALTGLVAILIPFAGGPMLVAALFLLVSQMGDITRTVYTINEVSLRQAITPDHLLGRTNATMHFIEGGVGLIGLLIGGLLAELIGMRLTLLLGASGMAFSALWLFFSPVRRLTTYPAPIEGPMY